MAEPISLEELRLAARNHGMPLEALRYDVTPAGLHYLLIHYDIPPADADTWTLTIDGDVERPTTLTLEDLRGRPAVDLAVMLECAGNGRALLEPRPVSQPWLLDAVGNAVWTGTPLRGVLDEAGVGAGAVEVLFTGVDQGIEGEVEQDYERSLPIDEADSTRRPPRVGDERAAAPTPARVPASPGRSRLVRHDAREVLRRVTVLTRPFDGYQQARGYRIRRRDDESGEPVARIRVRSLMLPPGFPDFMTRARVVDAGPLTLRGRAWSGFGTIERVEVSDDGGRSWGEATLGPAPGSVYAWRAWSFAWEARPGERHLCCRATDATGATQPLEPRWNMGGYANNAVQHVPVLVR